MIFRHVDFSELEPYLDVLTWRERFVIAKRYKSKMTLREIGLAVHDCCAKECSELVEPGCFAISQGRVKNILNKANRKILEEKFKTDMINTASVEAIFRK